MIDYDTNQWLILNYPQAAGGKFLATCFMMFDKVANWAERELTADEIVSWYKSSMPTTETWFATEIDTPWSIPASRLWQRGAELTKNQFWEQFTPTPWFTYSWARKNYIVDFWHKPVRPVWWSNATWVNIDIDDYELYKKILFSKVFEYNPTTQTVIWTSQLPELGRPTAVKNKTIYQNQWVWDNVTDLNNFYHNVVLQHTCFKWQRPTNTDKLILLSELFDVDKLVEFLLQFEERLESKLNVECVKQIHTLWLNATHKLI